MMFRKQMCRLFQSFIHGVHFIIYCEEENQVAVLLHIYIKEIYC